MGAQVSASECCLHFKACEQVCRLMQGVVKSVDVRATAAVVEIPVVQRPFLDKSGCVRSGGKARQNSPHE